MKPRERRKAVAGAEPRSLLPPADTGLGIPDDRILGEISHEMGNYFHKLYYWTEYLRDRDGHGMVPVLEHAPVHAPPGRDADGSGRRH